MKDEMSTEYLKLNYIPIHEQRTELEKEKGSLTVAIKTNLIKKSWEL